MTRGDVWWAELPPPSGRRPVVLLSRNETYAVRRLLTVAPVTTRVRGIRSEVPLGPADGLPRPCAANLDTITTIPKSMLSAWLAHLSEAKLREVDDAVHFALGLRE